MESCERIVIKNKNLVRDICNQILKKKQKNIIKVNYNEEKKINYLFAINYESYDEQDCYEEEYTINRNKAIIIFGDYIELRNALDYPDEIQIDGTIEVPENKYNSISLKNLKKILEQEIQTILNIKIIINEKVLKEETEKIINNYDYMDLHTNDSSCGIYKRDNDFYEDVIYSHDKKYEEKKYKELEIDYFDYSFFEFPYIYDKDFIPTEVDELEELEEIFIESVFSTEQEDLIEIIKNIAKKKITKKSNNVAPKKQIADFEYKKVNGGIEIVKCNLKDEKIINVPEEIENMPVISIGESAFEWNKLEKVILPSKIIHLKDSCFTMCDRLSHIVIPESVMDIEQEAFSGCGALTKIEIPGQIKTIEEETFNNCYNLEEINIKPGVENIEKNAFYPFKLNKIIIADTVKNINEAFCEDDKDSWKIYKEQKIVVITPENSYAQKYFERLNKELYNNFIIKHNNIEAQDIVAQGKFKVEEKQDGTIKIIGIKTNDKKIKIIKQYDGKKVNELSLDYIQLDELIIEENIKKIKFTKSTKINSIIVSKENKNFYTDENALYDIENNTLISIFNANIKEYKLPNGITKIAESAFANIKQLNKLILNNEITCIEDKSFNSLLELQDIENGKNLEYVGKDIWKTKWFQKLEEEQQEIILGKILLKVNYVDEEKYFVKDGIKTIGEDALYEEKKYYPKEIPLKIKATDIVLPSSVNRICPKAFSKTLEKINLENVREIDDRAFISCKNLKVLKFSDELRELKYNTFGDLKDLEKIHIPRGVEKIHKTFLNIYLSEHMIENKQIELIKLSEITVDEENKFFKDIQGVLYSKDGKRLIKVPYNYNKKEFIVPETVEIVEESAFVGNHTIEKIIINDNVKKIEQLAFSYCVNLKEIQLPSNFDTIQPNTFENCVKLSKIKWPKNLKTIKTQAFKNTNIKVNIPDTVENIENRAFEKSKAKKYVLPKNVKNIGLGVFSEVKEIEIYDTEIYNLNIKFDEVVVDKDIKEAQMHVDEYNGLPNSNVGWIGIEPPSGFYAISIGNAEWHDHIITVRNSKTDEIKFRVWMGAEGESILIKCVLTSMWGKNSEFDFEKFDNIYYKELKNKENKIRYAVNRIAYPYKLNEKAKQTFKKLISKDIDSIIKNYVGKDEKDLIKRLTAIEW